MTLSIEIRWKDPQNKLRSKLTLTTRKNALITNLQHGQIKEILINAKKLL